MRVHQVVRHSLRTAATLFVAALACAAAAANAGARGLYVTDGGQALTPGSVLAFQTQSRPLTGSPIAPPAHPIAIAISPDGRTAYVADAIFGISTIDTRTNTVFGSPIAVGSPPGDLAVSPDGGRLYVPNFTGKTVEVIDTRSGEVLPNPIPVGVGPEGIVVSPDGKRAYVANSGSGNVSVIDTEAGKAVDTITVGKEPEGVGITPDGKRLFVADSGAESVTVIDTQTDKEVAGSPVKVGETPEEAVASPDGRSVYVGDVGSNSISVIDTATLGVSSIPVGEEPRGIAFEPDGRTAYVANLGDATLSTVDTASRLQVGTAAPAGLEPRRAAVVPDQPPAASIAAPLRVRPGVPVTLDGGASRDPDGSIARFDWEFGDGATAANGGPAPRHVFARPGSYRVSLRLTDDEGCSTAFVFTGQTAACNGSGVAATARTVSVSYPEVAVRCPARAKAKGCLFKLQAVTEKRRGKAQTALARVKVKAGRSAVVPLKPSAAFAATLAGAGSVLVKDTARVGSAKQTTSFARLKIVG